MEDIYQYSLSKQMNAEKPLKDIVLKMFLKYRMNACVF